MNDYYKLMKDIHRSRLHQYIWFLTTFAFSFFPFSGSTSSLPQPPTRPNVTLSPNCQSWRWSFDTSQIHRTLLTK